MGTLVNFKTYRIGTTFETVRVSKATSSRFLISINIDITTIANLIASHTLGQMSPADTKRPPEMRIKSYKYNCLSVHLFVHFVFCGSVCLYFSLITGELSGAASHFGKLHVAVFLVYFRKRA